MYTKIKGIWYAEPSFPRKIMTLTLHGFAPLPSHAHSGHWEHPKLLGSGSVIIRWHMSGVYLWPHGIADSFLFTLSVPMWAINHVNDLIIIAPEWNKELWPFLDNSISGLFFNTTALLKHNLHTILLTHLKLQLSGCIFRLVQSSLW